MFHICRKIGAFFAAVHQCVGSVCDLHWKMMVVFKFVSIKFVQSLCTCMVWQTGCLELLSCMQLSILKQVVNTKLYNRAAFVHFHFFRLLQTLLQ